MLNDNLSLFNFLYNSLKLNLSLVLIFALFKKRDKFIDLGFLSLFLLNKLLFFNLNKLLLFWINDCNK